jgi:hypothetical protein
MTRQSLDIDRLIWRLVGIEERDEETVAKLASLEPCHTKEEILPPFSNENDQKP